MRNVMLITGASRGIGAATALLAAERGYAVVLNYLRNREAAEALRQRIERQGGEALAVAADVAEEGDVERLFASIDERFGRLDVLVNNFGTSNPRKDRDIETTTFEDYIGTVNVNLASVFLTTQAVLPHMKKNGGGSIINISSIGGLVPDISQIAYGTSKAAINYLTKLIAVQEARSNIRCNAVLPGMTATDAVTNNLSDDFRDFFLKHTPIKRMGLPEEIAATVAYFASDDSAYTTGQIVAVSGGFGLPTPIYGDMIERSERR